MINPLAYKKKRLYSRSNGNKPPSQSNESVGRAGPFFAGHNSDSARGAQESNSDYRYESGSEAYGNAPIRVSTTGSMGYS